MNEIEKWEQEEAERRRLSYNEKLMKEKIAREKAKEPEFNPNSMDFEENDDD